MNIGNIHFYSKRYAEALESFGAALIQANYELGIYSSDINYSNNSDRPQVDMELLQLKFDRSFSFSQALKMNCLNS